MDETGMTIATIHANYQVRFKHYTEAGAVWKTAYEGNDIERAERIYRSQTEQRFEVEMIDLRSGKRIRHFAETR